MRHWLFHPLIFYPLALFLATMVIAVSVKPQSWPRDPAPVAAEAADGILVYSGAAFDTPSPAPHQQNMTVVRDFWGRAQKLRIAVLPRQPAPTPDEAGVRLLMTAADARRIENRPVTVEVTYNALSVNAASDLAVSLQGAGAAAWVSRPTPPDAQVVRFDLPAQSGVNAIGLRAIHSGAAQAFGVEITRIRVMPRA